MPPKQWHTKSGTLKSECPKCHDLGYIVDDCELCEGTNECGMATAVQWILNHGDTDPPPTDSNPDGETKPE